MVGGRGRPQKASAYEQAPRENTGISYSISKQLLSGSPLLSNRRQARGRLVAGERDFIVFLPKFPKF
jgi:hypothetical protein